MHKRTPRLTSPASSCFRVRAATFRTWRSGTLYLYGALKLNACNCPDLLTCMHNHSAVAVVCASSSNKPKHELLGEIHSAAAQLGISVTCRDSNHEGEILDWLLGVDAGSTIVLCWNGTDCLRAHLCVCVKMCSNCSCVHVWPIARLSECPNIIRALELLESHAVAVVVVSPVGVEHGALPASVRGVISGAFCMDMYPFYDGLSCSCVSLSLLSTNRHRLGRERLGDRAARCQCARSIERRTRQPHMQNRVCSTLPPFKRARRRITRTEQTLLLPCGTHRLSSSWPLIDRNARRASQSITCDVCKCN